jgi:hypothetical protein
MRMNALVRIARGDGDWRQPRGRRDIVALLEEADTPPAETPAG